MQRVKRDPIIELVELSGATRCRSDYETEFSNIFYRSTRDRIADWMGDCLYAAKLARQRHTKTCRVISNYSQP